jgi:uncharacterized protein (DUF58 family)
MRPNRHTVGLFGVLLAMWYAGASQGNAAAYLLCFLTFSVVAVSGVHSWSNLRGLRLTLEPVLPIFEGENVLYFVHAQAEPGRRHLAVQLRVEGSATSELLEVISSETGTRLQLAGPPLSRGRYSDVVIVATSTFPLGFFTARQRLSIPQEHYVYPRPTGSLGLPTELDRTPETQSGLTANEGDDFAGVSEWHRGQSMRHVDWKAVARGQRLMVKQWNGTSLDPFTFRWDSLPQLPVEDRLRQLARWAVLAERTDTPYALELPALTIPISRGEAHFHLCLRALAEVSPQS